MKLAAVMIVIGCRCDLVWHSGRKGNGDGKANHGNAASNWSGLLPQRTHCYVRRPVDLLARRRAEGSPREVRGFGSCERQFRRREPRSPNDVDPFHKIPEPQERCTQEGERQIERDIPAQGHVSCCQRQETDAICCATAKAPLKAGEPKVVRATKQKSVLTLLSQSEGARHDNADVTEDKSVIDFPMDGAPSEACSTTTVLAQLFIERDAGAGAVHTVTLLKIGCGFVGIRCYNHAAATTSRHVCRAESSARIASEVPCPTVHHQAKKP
jgi:hypothetical protein